MEAGREREEQREKRKGERETDVHVHPCTCIARAGKCIFPLRARVAAERAHGLALLIAAEQKLILLLAAT